MEDIISYIINILLSIPGVMFTFTLKGYSQALVAKKLGDPTPENQGRLTMNPMAHIDIIGFICILLFRFGWCKPVQTNSRYYKHVRRDCAIQILSGPVGLVIGGFVMSLFYVLTARLFIAFPESTILEYIAAVFSYAAAFPLYLAIFYMLPLPGLDGYNLIANFLPYKFNSYLYKIEKYSIFIFLAFILICDYTPLGNLIFLPANVLIKLFTDIWSLPVAFLFSLF